MKFGNGYLIGGRTCVPIPYFNDESTLEYILLSVTLLLQWSCFGKTIEKITDYVSWEINGVYHCVWIALKF